ncbi:MAG: hypothetical protein DRJ42_10140 [Deltaproteobacteria bacterium]|nr:MAG: hypothetical protein DRJ42_10140 [Deltaproteobacteria bacterium]
MVGSAAALARTLGEMRYLYADSESFPLDYDFLATLRGFIECGAACLSAVATIDTRRAAVADERTRNKRNHGALDRYLEDARGGLEAAHKSNPAKEAVVLVGGRAIAAVTQTVSAEKSSIDDRLAQLEREAASKIDSQGETIRIALERFLLKERLEVEETFFELALEDEGYAISAVCQMPEGLSVTYELDAQRKKEWQRPRKMTEFVTDLEVQLGMKKKFLGKKLIPEVVKVGDWALVAATLGNGRASFTLRKKPESDRDTTVISVTRDSEGRVSGEVRRGVEKGADDQSRIPLAAEDRDKLIRLWKNVEARCLGALAHRESAHDFRLDGGDLLDDGQVVDFVQRYVRMYQPFVEQIALRSPSSKELSLKIEHDDGHREEIYLRRDELADVVAGLGDAEMKCFAPLDFFPEIEVEFD